MRGAKETKLLPTPSPTSPHFLAHPRRALSLFFDLRLEKERKWLLRRLTVTVGTKSIYGILSTHGQIHKFAYPLE